MEKKLRQVLTVSNVFTKVGFAKLLGTEPAVLLKTLNYKHTPFKNTSEGTTSANLDNFSHSFRYTIPPYTCVQSKTSSSNSSSPASKMLPLSGYLALFDDFTTNAIFTEDKKTRPGVSISLSAHLGSQYKDHRNGSVGVLPKSGDDIEFKIRVIKIGNLLGFAQGKAICCKTGNIVAHGNHVKYLPGSFLSEMVLGPLLPLSNWMVTNLYSKKDKKLDNAEMTVDDALDLKIDYLPENGRIPFQVKKYHHNPWGTLHVSVEKVFVVQTLT